MAPSPEAFLEKIVGAPYRLGGRGNRLFFFLFFVCVFFCLLFFFCVCFFGVLFFFVFLVFLWPQQLVGSFFGSTPPFQALGLQYVDFLRFPCVVIWL